MIRLYPFLAITTDFDAPSARQIVMVFKRDEDKDFIRYVRAEDPYKPEGFTNPVDAQTPLCLFNVDFTFDGDHITTTILEESTRATYEDGALKGWQGAWVQKVRVSEDPRIKDWLPLALENTNAMKEIDEMPPAEGEPEPSPEVLEAKGRQWPAHESAAVNS